jgi:syntaxin 18
MSYVTCPSHDSRHGLMDIDQLKTITALNSMLSNVRKPYLNVDARAPAYSRAAARTLDLSADQDQAWANVKYLTNEERDQIDVQARVILSRCADRVKEMEALEKRTCTIEHQRERAQLTYLDHHYRPC